MEKREREREGEREREKERENILPNMEVFLNLSCKAYVGTNRTEAEVWRQLGEFYEGFSIYGNKKIRPLEVRQKHLKWRIKRQ